MIRFIDKYRNCFSVEFICKTLKNNRVGGFITSRGYRQSKAQSLKQAVGGVTLPTCARRKALCTPRLSPTFTPGGSSDGHYRIQCALQVLPLQALNQAIESAEETTGLIHHSDHGL